MTPQSTGWFRSGIDCSECISFIRPSVLKAETLHEHEFVTNSKMMQWWKWTGTFIYNHWTVIMIWQELLLANKSVNLQLMWMHPLASSQIGIYSYNNWQQTIELQMLYIAALVAREVHELNFLTYWPVASYNTYFDFTFHHMLWHLPLTDTLSLDKDCPRNSRATPG